MLMSSPGCLHQPWDSLAVLLLRCSIATGMVPLVALPNGVEEKFDVACVEIE